MKCIVDFLAEEELKATEQFVAEIFEVKPARQCRFEIMRKDAAKVRKAAKHERMAKLVKDLRAKAAKADR